MKHRLYPSLLVLAAVLLAMGLLSGCGYNPTATALPPVTSVAQATEAPATQAPAPAPSAVSPLPTIPVQQPPTAYPLPTTASGEADTENTPWSPYPQPQEPAAAGSTAALELTILHVNDVYGEIDPCG